MLRIWLSALLVLAGSSVVAGLPWWAIIALPALFAGGMSLLDTEDALARWLAAEQQRDALVAALAERQSAATLAHHRLAQGVGSARAALAVSPSGWARRCATCR